MMTQYNGYSVSTIEKLFNLGKEFAEKEMSLDSAIDEVFEMGYFDTDAINLVEAGMKYGDRIEISEKTWYRIGEPSIDTAGSCYLNSTNFSEDCKENGISVITNAWLNSTKSIFFGAHDNEFLKAHGVYKIKGVQIGFGGDDEPVIYATDWAEKTRIRTFAGLQKAVNED